MSKEIVLLYQKNDFPESKNTNVMNENFNKIYICH